MRLTPGALWLRLNQRFGKGLRVAYYRDIVRPRILRTAPVIDTIDSAAEIHVMTCSQDWLDLVWALKSFYWASRRRYRLCIHDDGSLLPEQRAAFQEHFPDARLIGRPDADEFILEQLRDFPKCREFRRTNVLAPKVFDFAAFLECDRMLLFDSDLMFFKEPTALLERIEDPAYRRNTFNADCGDGYTVRPDDLRNASGYDLVPHINSGLGLIHKGSIRFDWCEEFLGVPGILDGYFWRIEQTLIALNSTRFGAELLPDDYRVFLTRGTNGRVMRHYVGAVRHLMYGEGIRELVRQGVLASKPLR